MMPADSDYAKRRTGKMSRNESRMVAKTRPDDAA